jgi:small subunit ribosomal protein S21
MGGGCAQPRSFIALRVLVHENNVHQALRALKRKLQREGVFREMKWRRFYEKPSERTVREKSEAKRRARKLARKQAIREGLIQERNIEKRGAGRPRAASEPVRPGASAPANNRQ